MRILPKFSLKTFCALFFCHWPLFPSVLGVAHDTQNHENTTPLALEELGRCYGNWYHEVIEEGTKGLMDLEIQLANYLLSSQLKANQGFVLNLDSFEENIDGIYTHFKNKVKELKAYHFNFISETQAIHGLVVYYPLGTQDVYLTQLEEVISRFQENDHLKYQKDRHDIRIRIKANLQALNRDYN